MLEPSLHRQRHVVLDVSCRIRLSSFQFVSCSLANFGDEDPLQTAAIVCAEEDK